MKSQYLNELLNSRITLNEKETEIVESYIQKQSKPVKTQHLNHYKCLSALRGVSSSTTFADRYRMGQVRF